MGYLDYYSIAKKIMNENDCHTVVIYGSRANGDNTEDSDIDLLCIKDKGKNYQYAKLIDGFFVDAWVNSIDDLEYKEDFLKILNGKVLIEKDNIGTKILQDVEQMYKKGFTPFTDLEISNLNLWSRKMLNRAKKLDAEGNYRKTWLATDLIEIYFNIRNVWYLGSKNAFTWLKENDNSAYILFDNLYKNTTIENLEMAVNKVFENEK